MNNSTIILEINTAIDFCIDALNHPLKDSQDSVGNYQPVLDTIRKVAAQPYEGRGLGIGTYGYENHRSDWQSIYAYFEKRKDITYSLTWLNAILLLYDFGNYTETEIVESAQKIIKGDIIFNHILKHVITNLAVEEKIEDAISFISHFKKTFIFKEEDNTDQGYLIILKHYALKGDSQNFFRYFKQSKPAINKNEISDAKFILVKRYALQNGIEKSLALCEHKNLGEKFHFSMLYGYAQQGKLQELKAIFNKYPELKNPEQETDLQILAAAYLRTGNKLDADFDELFTRALNVDRSICAGAATMQDAILLDLGLASKGNAERVKMCRKAIKNNSIKKELIVEIY